MISFQQEMLLSERHKNTCNKLTETGNFWVAQFLKLFFADLEIPFNYKKIEFKCHTEKRM